MALQFFVGHSGGVTVDDAKVGWGDFVGREIIVGGRHIEHKAPTCGVPFLCFVLLFCVLLLDVVKLLVLDFVLVLGLLGGARDPSSKGPKDVDGIHCRGVRVVAALMLGMTWAQWRRVFHSESLPSSGAMENLVSATCSWWTPMHQ